MANGKVNLMQVAEKAGVSKATASMILNNSLNGSFSRKTTLRVIKTAKELGYSLSDFYDRGKNSNGLRVLFFTDDTVLRGGYFSEAFMALKESCRLLNVEIEMAPAIKLDEQLPQIKRYLEDRRFNGFLMAGYIEKAISFVQEQGFPLVVMGDIHTPLEPCAVVKQNNFVAGYISTEHLISNGHRRIAFLGYQKSGEYYNERLAGYREAMRRNSIAILPNLIQDEQCPDEHLSEFLDKVMKKNPMPPTAFVSCNGAITANIIEEVNALSLKIPDDLSLVSIDRLHNVPIWDKHITAVDFDMKFMTKVALKKLLKTIAGDYDEATVELIMPNLNENKSVKNILTT